MSSEWLTLLNRLLIFIVFPGISNPGLKPNSGTNLRHIENKDKNKNISVFYQNVQGLIPFSNLTDQHPCLDNNKIYELQAYIFSNSPDIIILNETWLKPTVLSIEICPVNTTSSDWIDRNTHIPLTLLTQTNLEEMEVVCCPPYCCPQ